MVFGEGVAFGVIERQHTDDPVQSFERHRQRATESAEFARIVQIAGLHRRIAVDDRLAVFRHPSRESLPKRDLERREQAEVFAVDIFRHKDVVLADVDRQRVVRDHAPQADRQHRESLVQAERVSQILRELEQRLHFLARCCDRLQEVDLIRGALRTGARLLETGRRRVAALILTSVES